MSLFSKNCPNALQKLIQIQNSRKEYAMPNYQNGKIYKITAGNLTYIGSTTEHALARRLAGHVSGYKKWKNETGYFTTSFPLIETGQYEITLIELFPCGSRDELNARERFHIESTVCVNKHIPGRTKKEWCEVNADTIREEKKAYYAANADRLLEQQKAHYEANKDTILEKQKTYYAFNADTIREKHKAYREANPDKIREQHKAYSKVYYEAHKDEINKRQREARAKKI